MKENKKHVKVIGREDLMRQIQEMEFALVDLNLFLDTHPENQRALMDFNMLANELMRTKKVYEMKYGPLTNFGSSTSRYPWQWIQGPWPWE